MSFEFGAMRRARWIIVGCALFAALIYFGIGHLLLTPEAAEKIREAVVSASGGALNEPLFVEKLSFDYRFRARLSGVRVGAERTDVLSADAVLVHLNFAALVLHPRNPALSVKRITVLRPRVRLEREADGKWNYQTVLKPPEPGMKRKFPSFGVRVRGGSVFIGDAEDAERGGGMKFRFEGVGGSLSCEGE
ncbi:MAG: hypothetical protein AB1742_09195, partial [bacterium]